MVDIFASEPRYWHRRVAAPEKDLDAPEVLCVEGGIVLPLIETEHGLAELQGGVVTPAGGTAGAQVAGHRVFFDESRPHKRDVRQGYAVSSDIDYVDEDVVYGGGRRARHFGHFLIETLSRLWYCSEEGGRGKRVVFPDVDLGRNDRLVDMLVSCGIRRDRLVFLDRPTRFRSVTVPGQSMYLGDGVVNFERSRQIFDRVRDSVTPDTVDKVYLTRSRLGRSDPSWREVNETMLEDFFRRQGYAVVSPEKLSFGEQVALMAGAKEVACTVGTVSHLLLFCQQNVRASLFLRSGRWAPPIQWAICHMRTSDWCLVDCTMPLLPAGMRAGVVYYATTEPWSQYAREWFGAEEPSRPTDLDITRYLKEWSECVATCTPDQLHRFPSWRPDYLASSISKFVSGAPLDKETRMRLRHFYEEPRRTARKG